MCTCTIQSCRQVCRASSRTRSSPQCCHHPQCMRSLPIPRHRIIHAKHATRRMCSDRGGIHLAAWHPCMIPCQPCSHPCPVLHCMVRASGRTHCTFTYHAQPPVAQSAPLYPAAHVHVHDPVVPPGVPCVESQTIVPAVLPSPAVHALAAKSQGIASSMAGRHLSNTPGSTRQSLGCMA